MHATHTTRLPWSRLARSFPVALLLVVLVPDGRLVGQGLLDPLDGSIAAPGRTEQYGLDRATRVTSLPQDYFDADGSGPAVEATDGSEESESNLLVPLALGLMILAGAAITAAGLIATGRTPRTPRVLVTH